MISKQSTYCMLICLFIQVNRLTADQEFPHVPNNEEKVRIVLSHIPLTFIHGIFSHAVMSKLKPNVIFSAHDHRVAMATTKLDPYTFEFTDLENSMTIQRSLNKEDCIEIIWPTCSYRMGVERSGYGIASISNNNKFISLWPPKIATHNQIQRGFSVKQVPRTEVSWRWEYCGSTRVFAFLAHTSYWCWFLAWLSAASIVLLAALNFCFCLGFHLSSWLCFDVIARLHHAYNARISWKPAAICASLTWLDLNAVCSLRHFAIQPIPGIC